MKDNLKDKPKFYPYVEIAVFIFFAVLIIAMLFPSIIKLR